MFRYLLTQGFFKVAMIGALVAFIGVFVFAVYLEKDNVPPPGMHMPNETNKALGKPILLNPETAPPSQLTIQHMSTRQVADRLSDVVAESLSFDKSNFIYNSGAMQKYFTPEGYAQYKAFLESANFSQALMTQNLRSGAYAEQDPLELSSGVYNGAYKWLFEVPVMISFVPADAETYRNDEAQAQNRKFTLRVQFTRVGNPQDPEDTRIEIWQVLPPRR